MIEHESRQELFKTLFSNIFPKDLFLFVSNKVYATPTLEEAEGRYESRV